MVWQLQSLGQGINEPPQDDLALAPGTFQLEDFLEGDGLTILVVFQHFVDSVEEDAPQHLSSVGAALREGEEIIYKDVKVLERCCAGLVRRGSLVDPSRG